MSNWSTDEACVSCGHSYKNMVCMHHVYSRKSYKEHQDKPWNKMPLCLICHEAIHRGMNKLIESRPSIKEWLLKNDWYFDEIKGAWKHENT